MLNLARIAALTCTFVICAGCAVRHTGIQTWRLVPDGKAGHILMPPGVGSPEMTRRTFSAHVDPGPGHCAESEDEIVIQPRNGYMRVTVKRDTLIKEPPGSLSRWAADLEARGCLAQGDGPKLAQLVAESLPLEAHQTFRLLYSGDKRTGEVDLGANVRLQVTSPILRAGVDSDAPFRVSGDDNNFNIAASTDLLGYEIAWYRMQPNHSHSGFMIVPVSAERHIGNTVEQRAEPSVNYFHFPPDAAFYRFVYKSGQTDFNALVIAGRTLPELTKHSKSLASILTSCRMADDYCVSLPQHVAVNPFVPVTMNGREFLVSWGATLAEAIRESGERQPANLVPRLMIYKRYQGRPTEIRFASAGPAILDLVLIGGEIISWKKP